MTEHESERLNNCHQTEHHSHRSGGTGTQLADEPGIHHIIQIRDQHTDGSRQSQFQDQPCYRFPGEPFILFLLF